MDVQIGQHSVELVWLAGTFVFGGLLGLFIGLWTWRLQWKSRRQAFEWLLEERRRNVRIAEENTNLQFIYQDRDRWRGIYEASLEAQGRLSQELGERNAKVTELSQEADALRGRLDELETLAGSLRKEVGDRDTRISEIVARNEMLSRQAEMDAGRAEDLQAELANARKLIAASSEELVALHDLVERKAAKTADSLNLMAANLQSAYGKSTDDIGKLTLEARDSLLSDVSGRFEEAASKLGKLAEAIRDDLEKRTKLIVENSDAAKRDVLTMLSGGFADAAKESQAMEKSLSESLTDGFKNVETQAGKMEKAIREELARQTLDLAQDVDVFKEVALGESRDAARAEYEARIAQLELASNTVLRKLSDQTQSILSSPQFIDFVSVPGAENDVPTNLTARVTTARVMRATGRLSEAVELLESCRSEDAHSRTVMFDLANCYVELRRYQDARSLVDSVSAETLETDAFRQRHTALRRTLAPGVFLCALPKSAGVFIYNSLATGLDKPLIHTGAGGYFPHMTIPQGAPELVSASRAIYHTHAEAGRSNIIEVNNRLNRMVLHLRDPRGALLSWTHFIARVVRSVDPVQRLHYGLPDDIEDWTFAKQLSWQVDHFLPVFIGWTEAWLEAIDDGDVEVPVLVTTYEELVADQDAFFDRLLDFSAIDHELFDYPARPTEGFLNFRKGDPFEWEEVFPTQVRKRARDMVPDALRDRFGWRE